MFIAQLENTALGLPENDNTPPNHPHLSLPSKNCTQGSCLSQRTNRLATWSLSNKENPFHLLSKKGVKLRAKGF